MSKLTLKDVETVYGYLCILENTKSSNEKISLLKTYLDNELFRTVVKYAYDQDLQFNIKSLGAYTPVNMINEETDIDRVFSLLDYMSNQRGASKQEKEKLRIASCFCKEMYEIVQRIVRKDLRCGINDGLINKAVPGTVKVMPYMRCSGYDKINRITFPAIAQKKADGVFANIICGDTVKFFSRNGKTFDFLGNLEHEFSVLAQRYCLANMYDDKNTKPVFMGEFLVLDEDGHILDRKTGNGIINKALKGTITENEAARVVCEVWDVIPSNDFWKGSSDVSYLLRFDQLKSIIDFSKKIRLIECEIVDNKEQSIKFYKDMRDAGYEGAIIKDGKLKWKDHTSPLAVKMKNAAQAEFIIVDVFNGDSGKKYENCLGGLIVESSDGKIHTFVGSGFTDADRGYPDKSVEMLKYWRKQIGKIVTVEFESIINNKDKNNDNYALYLPRFIELREDKDKADTFEYCENLSKRGVL